MRFQLECFGKKSQTTFTINSLATSQISNKLDTLRPTSREFPRFLEKMRD